MLWGEPGIMIYDDAYAVFAGARHPQLLGSPVREGGQLQVYSEVGRGTVSRCCSSKAWSSAGRAPRML